MFLPSPPEDDDERDDGHVRRGDHGRPEQKVKVRRGHTSVSNVPTFTQDFLRILMVNKIGK